jgi:hypothetical protein
MRYKVTEKKIEFKNGARYYIWIYCGQWLECSKDDFDRIQIEDEIELLITVVPQEITVDVVPVPKDGV